MPFHISTHVLYYVYAYCAVVMNDTQAGCISVFEWPKVSLPAVLLPVPRPCVVSCHCSRAVAIVLCVVVCMPVLGGGGNRGYGPHRHRPPHTTHTHSHPAPHTYAHHNGSYMNKQSQHDNPTLHHVEEAFQQSITKVEACDVACAVVGLPVCEVVSVGACVANSTAR